MLILLTNALDPGPRLQPSSSTSASGPSPVSLLRLATFGLSLYTAAFVCEAVRSGVNSVAFGQAEAARSIGMGFTLSLREVVLPQAFRAVIPPLTST